MATFSMTDVTTWVHGYNFTTDLNQISLKAEVDDLDKTTFGTGGYKGRAGGLRDVTLALNGFWDVAPDSESYGDLGAMNRVVTVSPTGAVGDVAYMSQLGKFSYEAFGSVGDMTPFTLDCSGSTKFGLVRGKVAAAPQTVASGSTGPLGSPLNFGGVGATQNIYVAVHVFSAGTSISLQVQSDAASDFATPQNYSTPTTITTAGGTWFTRIPGTIGDQWLRLNITTATSGAFTLAAAIAVQ